MRTGYWADARLSSVRRWRRGSETDMHYYLPIDQFSRAGGGLFVRTHGAAAAQADEVRRALQQVMPGVSYVPAARRSAPPYTVLWAIARSSDVRSHEDAVSLRVELDVIPL